MKKRNSIPDTPLAERIRPKDLGEFYGQENLVGKGKPIRLMIENDTLSSFILWGPPGSGKTTLAKIIAEKTNAEFFQLNAVSSGVKDLRRVIDIGLQNRQMSKKTILVAEDEEFLRSLLKTKLAAEGFEVYDVDNGEKALEELKARDFDLVVLDLLMPKMSGFDVIKEMKKDVKLSKIPIIILSNLGQESDIEKGKELGAVDYIVKSNISIDDIAIKINNYLTSKAKSGD